jgi:Periplasmic component of the Tol biopolymer transport system
LRTRKATKLPGSDGLYSPRWSPDGRSIAAITLDSLKLKLFDLATQKWTEVANIFVAYPAWSRDGRYLYFNGRQDNTEGYYRVQVSDHKLERLFSMKGFQAAGGAFGKLEWAGAGGFAVAGARREHTRDLRAGLGRAVGVAPKLA